MESNGNVSSQHLESTKQDAGETADKALIAVAEEATIEPVVVLTGKKRLRSTKRRPLGVSSLKIRPLGRKTKPGEPIRSNEKTYPTASDVRLTDQLLEGAVETGPNRIGPSMVGLEVAGKIRAERESQYNRANLKEHQIEGYAISMASEINIRFTAVEHEFFEIGRLVYDARQILRHGKFGEWLAKYICLPNQRGRSRSTVLNCMRVYEACMGCPEVVQLLSKSALYKICEPDFPRDLREFLLENAAGLQPMKHRELISVARKYRDYEIDLDSPEIQGLLKKQKDQKAADRALKELKLARSALDQRVKVLKQLANESKSEPILPSEESARKHRHYDESLIMLNDFVKQISDRISALENYGTIRF